MNNDCTRYIYITAMGILKCHINEDYNEMAEIIIPDLGSDCSIVPKKTFI